jgi:hypothetical protein
LPLSLHRKSRLAFANSCASPCRTSRMSMAKSKSPLVAISQPGLLHGPRTNEKRVDAPASGFTDGRQNGAPLAVRKADAASRQIERIVVVHGAESGTCVTEPPVDEAARRRFVCRSQRQRLVLLKWRHSPPQFRRHQHQFVGHLVPCEAPARDPLWLPLGFECPQVSRPRSHRTVQPRRPQRSAFADSAPRRSAPEQPSDRHHITSEPVHHRGCRPYLPSLQVYFPPGESQRSSRRRSRSLTR